MANEIYKKAIYYKPKNFRRTHKTSHGETYVPSAPEQKMIEHLSKGEWAEAWEWSDYAFIDDPSRIRRIHSEWQKYFGLRFPFGWSEKFLKDNKKEKFLEDIDKVYFRQRLPFPEDREWLFRRASKDFQTSPAYAERSLLDTEVALVNLE